MKTCNVCHEEKPYEAFYKNAGRAVQGVLRNEREGLDPFEMLVKSMAVQAAAERV